ncbi:MAG: hypothetical protein KC591_09980 [Gemmatimonadetes bacterium]|nr:hypothetical protein [Gemmatimonadota bacterium]
MTDLLDRLRRQERRRWATAALVTLGVHVAILVWIARLGPLVASPAEAAPEPLQVVFAPEKPRVFTELPDDRKDEAPERADLLSNVTSRARDRVEGGQDEAPRSQGLAELPSVRLTPGQPQTAPAPAPERPAPAERAKQETPTEDRGELAAELPLARPEDTSLRELLLNPSTDPRTRPPGDSDILQEAFDDATSNAGLTGDISLNTMEWEYAPWMREFRRAVQQRWNAPIAFQMGMIDGWVLARATVSPAGKLVHLEVLDQEVGHPSLTEAVVYALEKSAPYRPLPANFPEENLVITIRFVYPKVRRY